MNTVTLYGSIKCPDCPPAMDLLHKHNIDFSFVEILESMTNLKNFLAIRDKQEVLRNAREKHFVGIPCIFWETTQQYYLDINIFLQDYFSKN